MRTSNGLLLISLILIFGLIQYSHFQNGVQAQESNYHLYDRFLKYLNVNQFQKKKRTKSSASPTTSSTPEATESNLETETTEFITFTEKSSASDSTITTTIEITTTTTTPRTLPCKNNFYLFLKLIRIKKIFFRAWFGKKLPNKQAEKLGFC